MPDMSVAKLCKLLVRHGLMTQEQASQTVVSETATRQRIEKEQQSKTSSRKVRYQVSAPEVIARLSFTSPDDIPLDEDRVMEVVAKAAKVPYRKIDPLKLDADLITDTMSRAYARRNVAIPLAKEGAKLVVAVSNPFDIELVQTLRDITRHDIQLVVSSKTDILKSITEIYGFQRAVSSANKELKRGPDISNLEQFVTLKAVDDIEANDQHIINAVDYIFHYAFDQRASDIHVEPKREQSIVRMRIDGVLHEVYTLPRVVHGAVASRIKMLARMDIAERRRPQDGRIKTEREGREVELRVSSLPVAFGEKLVLRIFDPQFLMQSLDTLGFYEDDLVRWREFVSRPNGMILVTGPTGSGKTTTLYSTLNAISGPRVNVTTIEDPVEMVFEQFNQVMVQRKIDLDFAGALRTVLRQDPDVIMVGEIRDPETAEMAVQAALTGHLVFSTLHTNDAPSAVTRLRDLGIEPFKIASTLVGVMAQRLLRRVCDQCRTATELTEDQIALLQIKLPPGGAKKLPVHRGEGCVKCRHTGLYGRTGVFELLPMSPSVQRIVKQDGPADDLQKAGRADGMKTLRESAIRKLAQGHTSFEEVAAMLGDMTM